MFNIEPNIAERIDALSRPIMFEMLSTGPKAAKKTLAIQRIIITSVDFRNSIPKKYSIEYIDAVIIINASMMDIKNALRADLNSNSWSSCVFLLA
ncbi:hypothetical protein D3C84_1110300 [compost metagenome]